MSLTTLKHVFSVNKGSLPQTNHHFFNHYLFRTGQTSGFTLTFLDQCLLPDVNTKTSSASQMPSPNTAVENKEAETVAKAIFSEWFCKFGIPAQIHTDGGKEFVNKLSNELFTLLNVSHTKTTLAHPQCNLRG
jgi:hypothetical protein